MSVVDLYNLKTNVIYKKPLMSIIDIDISMDIPINFEIDSIQLPIFKAVMLDDIDRISNYARSNYIERNLNHQTPLMLAAKLNKVEIVKLLLNECCQIDDDNFVALDFAINNNADEEIVEMLKRFECYK